MSTEAVKNFWQKAQQDKSLQAKLAAIEEKHRRATVADIVTLATEAGFVFTAAEYDAAVKETLAKEHGAGDLSEEQLQQIAGGARGAFALMFGKQSIGPQACSGFPGCDPKTG